MRRGKAQDGSKLQHFEAELCWEPILFLTAIDQGIRHKDSRKPRIFPFPITKPVNFLSPKTSAGIELTPTSRARARSVTKLTFSTSISGKSFNTLASARPAN